MGGICHCVAGKGSRVSAHFCCKCVILIETRLRRSVALKILVSELEETHQEGPICNYLSSGPEKHPGRQSVAGIHDLFQVQGPNGVHQCLVQEVLGASLSSIAEASSDYRLSGAQAWTFAKQVVMAISYMHRMGVVHGGLFTCTHRL